VEDDRVPGEHPPQPGGVVQVQPEDPIAPGLRDAAGGTGHLEVLAGGRENQLASVSSRPVYKEGAHRVPSPPQALATAATGRKAMALVDDLKTQATQIIVALDSGNPDFTRDEVKEFPFDFLGMNPAALQLVIRAGQYMASFTETIDQHKASLLPWVTVYGAGLGMQGVFNRILYIWARTQKPGPNDPLPPPEVQTAIDEDIERYVKLISS
jgi:hypothetical protein